MKIITKINDLKQKNMEKSVKQEANSLKISIKIDKPPARLKNIKDKVTNVRNKTRANTTNSADIKSIIREYYE